MSEEDYENRWLDVQARIGKAVVAWSRLEFFILMTFRAVLHDCSPAVSAHLARSMPTNALLEALKLAAKEYPATEAASVLDWVRECSRLAVERNEMFHGSYADQSDGTTWHPTVIWTSRRGGGKAPDYLEFQRVDGARLDAFSSACGSAMKAHSTLPAPLSSWLSSEDESPEKAGA